MDEDEEDEQSSSSSSSEWWDRLGEIGSPNSLLLPDPLSNNGLIYSPPRPCGDGWSAVSGEPWQDRRAPSSLEFFGVQFGSDAYLPPARTTAVSPPLDFTIVVSVSILSKNTFDSSISPSNSFPQFLGPTHGNQLSDEIIGRQSYPGGFWLPVSYRFESIRIVEGGIILSFQWFIREENDPTQMRIPLDFSVGREVHLSPNLLRTLPDFQLAKIKESYVSIKNTSMDRKVNLRFQYIYILQPPRSPLRLEAFPNGGEVDATTIGGIISGDDSYTALSHSKKKRTSETQERNCRNKRKITLEDLQQFSGQKRAIAAKNLGVSESTFKRYCRQNGITWWNGNNCSTLEPKLVANSIHQNLLYSKTPEVQREEETPAIVRATQNNVTIKAKYGQDIVKFQLSLTSGVAELKGELAKRLELEFGSFNVKYQDEDQEWVLITCDADFQDCVKFSRSLGDHTIRLLASNKVPNFENSCWSQPGSSRGKGLPWIDHGRD